MPCLLCGQSADFVHLWNDEKPNQGVFGLCDACESRMETCGVCGGRLDQATGLRQYQILSDTGGVSRLRGYCGPACAGQDNLTASHR